MLIEEEITGRICLISSTARSKSAKFNRSSLLHLFRSRQFIIPSSNCHLESTKTVCRLASSNEWSKVLLAVLALGSVAADASSGESTRLAVKIVFFISILRFISSSIKALIRSALRIRARTWPWRWSETSSRREKLTECLQCSSSRSISSPSLISTEKKIEMRLAF